MSNGQQENGGAEYQYASNDEQAEAKYKQFRLKDPFPDIPPALLNSTDIKKYVLATGMIFPFFPEKEHLKQASYSVKMLGKCIFWDASGIKQEQDIREKEEFILRRNSITFVSLQPRFRIPYYIALRFNLKITHIHRGILLGTGPLVDPGFDGTLAVPLHNLTMNDYVLRGGDDLIWFEFTKLDPSNLEDYTEFRPDKSLKDINDYLHKSYLGNPIRSSLSDIRKMAEDAEKRTIRLKWGGIIGSIVGLLALVVAIVWPVLTLVTDATNYVKGARDKNEEIIVQQNAKIDLLETKIQALQRKIDDLEKKRIDRNLELKNPLK